MNWGALFAKRGRGTSTPEELVSVGKKEMASAQAGQEKKGRFRRPQCPVGRFEKGGRSALQKSRQLSCGVTKKTSVQFLFQRERGNRGSLSGRAMQNYYTGDGEGMEESDIQLKFVSAKRE